MRSWKRTRDAAGEGRISFSRLRRALPEMFERQFCEASTSYTVRTDMRETSNAFLFASHQDRQFSSHLHETCRIRKRTRKINVTVLVGGLERLRIKIITLSLSSCMATAHLASESLFCRFAYVRTSSMRNSTYGCREAYVCRKLLSSWQLELTLQKCCYNSSKV